MASRRRNAEKRVRSFSTLVNVLERALTEMTLNTAERMELQRHLALVQRSLNNALADMAEYGSRFYCSKAYVLQGKRLGRYKYDVWYTTEKDIDGWYWWGVRKSEDVPGARLPMSVERNKNEGKRRKRKDAKAIAEKKAGELLAMSDD